SLTSGGFWFYAFPEHRYEGVDIEDMASAPEIRENPIGIGPYKVDSIVTGETISLTKFEDYWRGEPQLDGIEDSVIPTSYIANAMTRGEIEVAASITSALIAVVHDQDVVEWLMQLQTSYRYIGFKLREGYEENGQVDYKPEGRK